MRVAVTGATGFVGSHLVPLLEEAGHEPVALTRDAARAKEILGERVAVRETDPYDVEAVRAAIDGCDGVVHLAGESLFARRWSRAFKAKIKDSRVETTRAIVQAMGAMARPPEVLVNASAIGVYGPREPGEAVDERTTDAGRFTPGDFLAGVAAEWERAAERAALLGVRVVRLRLGVVLGRGGGALSQMETPFRMYVGGPIGSGRQAVSWIHLEDVCRLVRFCLETRAASGAVNAVAPEPATNRELCRALAARLGRPCWLPVPPLALRVVLGEVASVLTAGQAVLPARAGELGFTWRYPTLDAAMDEIYAPSERRQGRSAASSTQA